MILLCSNGLTSQELLREAKKQAKNGKKAALVVTADPEYKEKNYHVPRNVKELEFLGLSVELFDFDKDPAEKLFSYDVVCLMGGNPYYLLHSIREHHGEEALQAVAENRLLIGYDQADRPLSPPAQFHGTYRPDRPGAYPSAAHAPLQ